jgi:hypothetical protein
MLDWPVLESRFPSLMAYVSSIVFCCPPMGFSLIMVVFFLSVKNDLFGSCWLSEFVEPFMPFDKKLLCPDWKLGDPTCFKNKLLLLMLFCEALRLLTLGWTLGVVSLTNCYASLTYWIVILL